MATAIEANLAQLNLPEPFPHRYTNEKEFTASLEQKAAPRPCDGLYPRDGTVTVTEVEEAVSELTIPDQRLNVIMPAGMAAVSGAIRYALSEKGGTSPENPRLAYAYQLYSQSAESCRHLARLGVTTRGFDAGDKTAVEQMIDKYRPDVIFAETVANAPDTPVLDLHNLLKQIREQGKAAPLVVIDNSLPLSTGLNLKAILRPEDPVMVVESATKTIMNNSAVLGVVYSLNEALIDNFRKFKVTEGLVTSTHADPAILRTIQESAPSFHARNRAIFNSTAKLATALSEAQGQTDHPEFTILFPTFPEHPNYDYAQKHLTDGSSPVAFAACTDFHNGVATQLLRRITRHPRMKEQIDGGQIYINQSFGFKEAALLYDPNACYVRVAGGYGIDSDALADALKEAAADV